MRVPSPPDFDKKLFCHLAACGESHGARWLERLSLPGHACSPLVPFGPEELADAATDAGQNPG